MNITYLTKEQMGGKFGFCTDAGQIFIRKCLPVDATRFVLEHEIYHSTDKAKNWVWREVKANFFAGLREPIGFIIVLWMTIFDLDRWIYYLDRIRKGG